MCPCSPHLDLWNIFLLSQWRMVQLLAKECWLTSTSTSAGFDVTFAQKLELWAKNPNYSPVVRRRGCWPKKKKSKNPRGNSVCILRRTLKRNSCCFNEEQPVVGCWGILLPPLHAEVCSLRWTRPAGKLGADPEDDGATKYTIWPVDSIGGRWRSSRGEMACTIFLFQAAAWTAGGMRTAA